MKKYLILSSALICTACVSIAAVTQETQELVKKLETQKDPVEVIEAYDMYKPLCILKDYHVPPVEECIKKKALTDPEVLISCVNTDRYNDDPDRLDYNSDECILYRRSGAFYESKVDYFDYKRFLGENSVIKTDDDFLNLVKRYNLILECDNMQETTTTEKETCKEKRKNEIRELAKRKVPCSELMNEQYTEYLKKEGNWFNWAIDHDPYATAKEAEIYRSMGFYAEAYQLSLVASPIPVWSRAKARKSIAANIKNFGVKNYCTTNDWETKIKKLGFKM